jgi:pimeloyl-ACP methyl ester carboxylesterase
VHLPLSLKHRLGLLSLIAVAASGLSLSAAAADAATPASTPAKPTIVLEHGAWADGSSWSGVITRLQAAGYTVAVPPNPLRGPQVDVPYLQSYLQTLTGPIVLVGHSYGGFVTTDAATGNPNVKALVYVDAYLPAAGETITSINTQFPGSGLVPTALSFVPSPGGVLDAYIKPGVFGTIMANGLPAKQAAELAATQRPIAAAALGEPSTAPAWNTIPSWVVIGTRDLAIPVAAQESMARRAHARVTKIDAPHLSMLADPAKVAAVIESAARKS